MDPELRTSDGAENATQRVNEISALVTAATLLLIVLIVSYVILLLLDAREDRAGAETFMNDLYYRGACSKNWHGQEGTCRGLSSSYIMPSIEEYHPVSWQPCCGTLGVPPPESAPRV